MVKTGIDGISMTFSSNVMNVQKIAEAFGADPALFIRQEKCDLNWYQECFRYGYELNGRETVLMSYYCLPISQYGKRDLLQIHGLCFSDSALNMLRPFDLQKLLDFIIDYRANITKFDVYLDDYTAAISQAALNEMLQPHTFEDFVQSPFLKMTDGERPEPRHFKTTWYLGKRQSNACEICSYDKGRSPRQGIHTAANPLKYTWQRYELRFSGDTSKRLGRQLFAKLAYGGNLNHEIVELFKKYLRFVVPSKSKRLSAWPLQGWYSQLLEQAEQNS